MNNNKSVVLQLILLIKPGTRNCKQEEVLHGVNKVSYGHLDDHRIRHDFSHAPRVKLFFIHILIHGHREVQEKKTKYLNLEQTQQQQHNRHSASEELRGKTSH